jgi:hypothetical protein
MKLAALDLWNKYSVCKDGVLFSCHETAIFIRILSNIYVNVSINFELQRIS